MLGARSLGSLPLGPLTSIEGDLRKRLVTVHGAPATSKLT